MVEGAPHTAKERSVDQLVCSRGAPSPVDKGGEEEGADQGERRALGGAILL